MAKTTVWHGVQPTPRVFRGVDQAAGFVEGYREALKDLAATLTSGDYDSFVALADKLLSVDSPEGIVPDDTASLPF